ncbi:MAG: DUF87 domain-containing protein [Phycisphaera sp.]|nr:MAG: DUF87 domain-containing protein [Phycisphaera sp.]
MTVHLTETITLDPARLAQSRAVIQASSGGGKSYLLRSIVEQAADQMPVIVIDPEGEFFTIREVASMVLVGPHGEIPCELKSARQVARALMEHACSAIIDLSELPTRDHEQYVADFLKAVMGAPRACWRPTIIAIDEAHRFCPEGMRSENSAAQVIDLMSRGRKRGYGGILLSQRISKLRKDAIAEAGNQFLGMTTLDIDIKRAADMLGMSRADAQVLRELKPGEWFAHGPALSEPGVSRFRASRPQTSPPDGATATVPPVKHSAVMRALAEAVKDIAGEGRPLTLEDAEKTITQLRRELAKKSKMAPEPDPAAVQRAVDQALAYERRLRTDQLAKVGTLSARAARILDEIQDFAAEAEGADHSPEPRKMVAPAPDHSVEPTKMVAPASTGSAQDRVLHALAWWFKAGVELPTTEQVAFVASISPRSSTIRAARSELKKAGLIAYYGQGTSLTAQGRGAVEFPKVGTIADWHAMIRQQLSGASLRVFEVVLERDGLDVEEVAQRAEVSPGSSTIRAALAELRKLGLIKKGQPIRGTDLLYPESLNNSRSAG